MPLDPRDRHRTVRRRCYFHHRTRQAPPWRRSRREERALKVGEASWKSRVKVRMPPAPFAACRRLVSKVQIAAGSAVSDAGDRSWLRGVRGVRADLAFGKNQHAGPARCGDVLTLLLRQVVVAAPRTATTAGVEPRQ